MMLIITILSLYSQLFLVTPLDQLKLAYAAKKWFFEFSEKVNLFIYGIFKASVRYGVRTYIVTALLKQVCDMLCLLITYFLFSIFLAFSDYTKIFLSLKHRISDSIFFMILQSFNQFKLKLYIRISNVYFYLFEVCFFVDKQRSVAESKYNNFMIH